MENSDLGETTALSYMKLPWFHTSSNCNLCLLFGFFRSTASSEFCEFVFPHRLLILFFLIIYISLFFISLVLSQCGTIDYGSYVNLTERNLQDAQKFILMHEVVQPVVSVPYFMEDNVRFSHVAVDVVQGKDMLYHIIYLATGIVPHHVCIERKRRSVSSIYI